MRGKVHGYTLVSYVHRITPACAGKRLARVDDDVSHGDHPRVCGEKCDAHVLPRFHLGSPPRVRGKVAYLLEDNSRDGITPACAGKRSGSLSTSALLQDHPRVCGEKLFPPCLHGRLRGSPPRVRGKELQQRWKEPDRGITPACAGKRCRPSWICLPEKDHPRVCGEKTSSSSRFAWELGSPPRVRGKGLIVHSRLDSARITPACAGKSYELDF